MQYFYSVWNYIDFIPPVGIIVIAIIAFSEDIESNDTKAIRTIMSVITFFMWFKVLFFLRLFKPTGYLIRMIVLVIVDMKSFLLVLTITIVAFGDSFLSLSLANKVLE